MLLELSLLYVFWVLSERRENNYSEGRENEEDKYSDDRVSINGNWFSICLR